MPKQTTAHDGPQEADILKIAAELRAFLKGNTTGKIEITVRQGRIQRIDATVQTLWSAAS